MNKTCTNDGCSCTANHAIVCSVTSCAHHCKSENYCGLDAIRVGGGEEVEKIDPLGEGGLNL